MSETYVSTEPARAEIERLAGPAVLEFGNPGCGYCRAAQSPLAAAFSAYPQVRHIKIPDGRGRPLGRSFGVKLWPTLVFLRDGSEIARLVRPAEPDSIRNALATITREG